MSSQSSKKAGLPKLMDFGGYGTGLAVLFPVAAGTCKTLMETPGEIGSAFVLAWFLAPAMILPLAMMAFAVGSEPKKFCTAEWETHSGWAIGIWAMLSALVLLLGLYYTGPWFMLPYAAPLGIGLFYLSLILRYRNYYLKHPDAP